MVNGPDDVDAERERRMATVRGASTIRVGGNFAEGAARAPPFSKKCTRTSSESGWPRSATSVPRQAKQLRDGDRRVFQAVTGSLVGISVILLSSVLRLSWWRITITASTTNHAIRE